MYTLQSIWFWKYCSVGLVKHLNCGCLALRRLRSMELLLQSGIVVHGWSTNLFNILRAQFVITVWNGLITITCRLGIALAGKLDFFFTKCFLIVNPVCRISCVRQKISLGVQGEYNLIVANLKEMGDLFCQLGN